MEKTDNANVPLESGENHLVQAALRERIKELTCLYGISHISESANISLDEILDRIVKILPPAWQYPDIAAARINFKDKAFMTNGFDENHNRLSEKISIVDGSEGEVSICYTEKKPTLFEGPFLQEECSLIVCRQRMWDRFQCELGETCRVA